MKAAPDDGHARRAALCDHCDRHVRHLCLCLDELPQVHGLGRHLVLMLQIQIQMLQILQVLHDDLPYEDDQDVVLCRVSGCGRRVPAPSLCLDPRRVRRSAVGGPPRRIAPQGEPSYRRSRLSTRDGTCRRDRSPRRKDLQVLWVRRSWNQEASMRCMALGKLERVTIVPKFSIAQETRNSERAFLSLSGTVARMRLHSSS